MAIKKLWYCFFDKVGNVIGSSNSIAGELKALECKMSLVLSIFNLRYHNIASNVKLLPSAKGDKCVKEIGELRFICSKEN